MSEQDPLYAAVAKYVDRWRYTPDIDNGYLTRTIVGQVRAEIERERLRAVIQQAADLPPTTAAVAAVREAAAAAVREHAARSADR